ncbi:MULTISPECIES: hypothetical protein [Haloferax]|uniref:hypothetical protein n=1 Tax=Haloferax TaxID=2251 RepID=UPI0012688482|nr:MULTISPECIES: hypothetical protein [Haloferax]
MPCPTCGDDYELVIGGEKMNVGLEDMDEEGYDIGKRTSVGDYEICLAQGSGGDVLYIHKL